MRRTLIVLILLAIVGGIAWWLIGRQRAQVPAADPWDALPPNCAVVLEMQAPVSTWQRATGTVQIWSAWEKLPGFAPFHALMGRLQGIADGNAAAAKAMDASTLLVALVPRGEGASAVWIWSLRPDRSLLAALGPALGGELDKVLVPGGERVRLQPDKDLSPILLTMHRGALVFSSDGPLLDELRTVDTDMPRDTAFARLRGTLGAGTDAHLLVHTGRARRLLNTWCTEAPLEPLNGLEGWLALDVRFRPEALLMSGLCMPDRSPVALRALEEQEPGRPGIGRVLPPDVHGLAEWNIRDAHAHCALVKGEALDEALFDAYGAWVHGAMGTAAAGADSTRQRWAVFRTDDPERARTALDRRCLTGCDTLSYRGARIALLPDTGALAAVWGAAFEAFEHPWYAVLGDRVVFSDAVNAMRLAIDAYTDGSSLQQDPAQGRLFDQQATDAAFTWYVRPKEALQAVRPALRSAGTAALDRYADGWSATTGALVQVSARTSGVYEVTACIAGGGPRPAADQRSDVRWTATIDAPITWGPYLVKDHLSRTRQVVVQDERNRLSLIACTGKVLWQRELDGPILGEVHQVDRYKNGKLQLLLNTAGRIHLIDRNGKDVEHFPVALPEAASTGLNVFDYEGRKEYRVLVPTVEAHLLNYDLNGKPVDGWKPPRTPNTCDVPVQFLRLRGKDHLVLVDHGGKVTVLDRRGEPRYAARLEAAGMDRALGLLPALDIGDVRLLWRDKDGGTHEGTLAGTVEPIPSAEDALNVNGALRYPLAGTERPAPVEDIDMDGRRERVSIDDRGRITATDAP